MGAGFLLVVLGAAASPVAVPQTADTVPQVTLSEAIRRSANLDPDYVAAARQIGDAGWLRRNAYMSFIVPSVALDGSAMKFSDPQFSLGTGEPTDKLVTGTLSASLDLFRGFGRFERVNQANASRESAVAGELQQRFVTAVRTEVDYYDVLAQAELLRVSEDRVRRAEEQLAVARARVVAGAAVQTDSLQLLLELTRAEVEVLQQTTSLAVARIQLGRRIGHPGPVDAAPLDTLPPPDLPFTEDEALHEAITGSPGVLVARADERAAQANFYAERSVYLPRVSAFFQWQGFDEHLPPDATTRTTFGLQLSLPIWNGGVRELNVYRAATSRDVAKAVRSDRERSVRRDMVAAYQAYNTARASAELASRGVIVASENLRVNEERYTAGATTILDLLSAQVSLTEAQAGLVQARFTTRLALAGVEAILGRRLFTVQGRGSE